MNIVEVIIYSLMAAVLVSLAAAVFFSWLYFRIKNSDKIIFIDKYDRWQMIEKKIKPSESLIKMDGGKLGYSIDKKTALLNSKGKCLCIYSVGNPMPLKLSWKGSEWLSSETLMNTINNELIKQLVRLSDKVKDIFIILGAIGGIIAAIASVVILLKTYGAI